MWRWQSGNAGDPTSPVSVREAHVAHVRRFESCPPLRIAVSFFFRVFFPLFAREGDLRGRVSLLGFRFPLAVPKRLPFSGKAIRELPRSWYSHPRHRARLEPELAHRFDRSLVENAVAAANADTNGSNVAAFVHVQNIRTNALQSLFASLQRIFNPRPENELGDLIVGAQIADRQENENESEQRFHARFASRIIFFAACFGMIEPYAAASAGVTWLRYDS